jgi:hypothetical protein
VTHFTIPGPMTVKRSCFANRPDIIVVNVCPAQHHHNSGTCTPSRTVAFCNTQIGPPDV